VELEGVGGDGDIDGREGGGRRMGERRHGRGRRRPVEGREEAAIVGLPIGHHVFLHGMLSFFYMGCCRFHVAWDGLDSFWNNLRFTVDANPFTLDRRIYPING
jgi:hypothetical protein